MDHTLISTARKALAAAIDMGLVAIKMRDFNAMASALTKVNEQLIHAQDALLSHHAQFSALNEKLLHTTKELAIAHHVIAQRGNYELVSLSLGVFAYRLKQTPSGGPTLGEPVHYVCQPCLDKGIKAVLVRRQSAVSISHVCTLCSTEYLEREIAHQQKAQSHDPYS